MTPQAQQVQPAQQHNNPLNIIKKAEHQVFGFLDRGMIMNRYQKAIYNTLVPLTTGKPSLTIICFALSLLTACSQKLASIHETTQLAFFGAPDVQLSNAQIEKIPYASLYAQSGNHPQSFMVLGFTAERLYLQPHADKSRVPPNQTTMITQLKWLSAQKEMLITEAGRIVKTVHIGEHDLLDSRAKSLDPIAIGLHLPSTPKKWIREIDVAPYYFGLTLHSQFKQVGAQVIDINGTRTATLYFTEQVHSDLNHIEYINEFWIEPNTGKVLKSREKPSPLMDHLTLTLLKPFAFEQ